MFILFHFERTIKDLQAEICHLKDKVVQEDYEALKKVKGFRIANLKTLKCRFIIIILSFFVIVNARYEGRLNSRSS